MYQILFRDNFCVFLFNFYIYQGLPAEGKVTQQCVSGGIGIDGEQ